MLDSRVPFLYMFIIVREIFTLEMKLSAVPLQRDGIFNRRRIKAWVRKPDRWAGIRAIRWRGRSALKTDGADKASPGGIQTALENGKEARMAKKKEKKAIGTDYKRSRYLPGTGKKVSEVL
jgi:hypothetical protein